MRAVAVAVAMLALFVLAEGLRHKHDVRWLEWKKKHSKQYASSDEPRAYTNFLNTLKRVMAHEGTSMGLNRFADMAPEEFQERYLTGFMPSAHKHMTLQEPLYDETDTAEEVPAEFDWRVHDAKAVTPVKDQGHCGACWAFSAVSALESQQYLANKQQLVLAPQQLVDCDHTDGGCNGGDLPPAFDYMKKNGVETEDAYKYHSGDNGVEGRCAFSRARVAVRVSSYADAVPSCRDSQQCDAQAQYEDAMKVALNPAAPGDTAPHGPPAVCVDASGWQDYTGGVFDGTCNSDYKSLDHCVQLVGYNFTAPQPYWIVRNQWGAHWGDQGYIYLKAGENACGFLNQAMFPIVAAKNSLRRHV